MSRLTARDFKKTPRRSLDVTRLREFGSGFLTGAVVAAGVFLYMRDAQPPQPLEAPRPEPRKVEAAEPPPGIVNDNGGQYDFYEMLPKFEVVVPEKDREVKRDLPASKVERPGVYVLQAGSYRNLKDADRVRTQLALQGVNAKVQRVAIDNDVWHRVRIGPISDLSELNRVRAQL